MRKLVITGGTGSLGRTLVPKLQDKYSLVVFSRNEYDQWQMEQNYPGVRYILGDVRDLAALRRAFSGAQYVIHAAALKHVAKCRENPQEAIGVNILGSQNVIQAAQDEEVPKVLAISTDKAVNPVSLYGATKLAADELFLNCDTRSGPWFSVIRMGNFADSRGSVMPKFRALASGQQSPHLPIHDPRMTRFHITLDQAADAVVWALDAMEGGEIFVPKMPSYRLVDLARHISPNAELVTVGLTPGEKLHEELITELAAQHTWDCGNMYVSVTGERVPEMECRALLPDFYYSSDTNTQWVFTQEEECKLL